MANSKYDLNEAQREFEEKHKNADYLVVNKLDGVIQAVYYSPRAQMRKLHIEGKHENKH